MADAELQVSDEGFREGSKEPKTSIARLAAEVERHKAEAERLRDEVERLRQEAADKDQTILGLQQERESADQDYLATIQKLRSSALSLRESFEQTKTELGEQQKEAAVLSSQLEERGSAIARIDDAQKALMDAIKENTGGGGLDRTNAERLSTVEDLVTDTNEVTTKAQRDLETTLQRLEGLTQSTERIGHLEEMTRGILWQLEAAAGKKGAAGGGDGGLFGFARNNPIAAGLIVGLSVMVAILLVLVVASPSHRTVGDSTAAPDEGGSAEPAVAQGEGEAAEGSDGGEDGDDRADDGAATAEGETKSEGGDQQADAGADPGADTTEGAEGEAGAADAGETEAAPAKPERKAGNEKDRKELRRKMFKAWYKKRWADVIIHGTTLRDFYRLDWEAELRLGDAFRNAKKFDEAIETYEGFVTHYPTSPVMDQAAFQLATVYQKQGKNEKARDYFKIVADNKKSKLAGKARKALKKLK